MKKILLALTLIISFTSFSQEKENVIDKKHEVRLGAVKLLAGGIFEGVYEYVQDSNKGFGAAVLINFDANNEYFEKYSLTPFYRMYFQTKEDYGAKGFFVEGFTSFFGGKDYDYFDTITSTYSENNYFDIAIGLGLGKKWINSAGFVFEIKVGGGRNLLGNSDIEAVFKGDFYIGYRF